MEKSVTLRFYEVSRTSENRPTFESVLDLISAKTLAQREAKLIPGDVLVRLEDFTRDDGCISGQFVRGQTGNRPGRMLADATGNLPFDEPLGHGIAFRYRTADGMLAIQYDTGVLAPSRVLAYLEAHEPRAEYRMVPKMRTDAVERFNELPVRKLEVAVAGAPNAEDLARQDGSVWSDIAQMKQRYGADVIRFQISRGNKGGALSNEIRSVAREALRRNRENINDIRSVRGLLQTGDGIPNDEVDLLGEMFNSKADLDVPGNDFPRFYELRRLMLKDRLGRL